MKKIIDFGEYLQFIAGNQLYGKGIGFVDIHLLASAQLGRLPLWTGDKRLNSVATCLGITYQKR